MKRSHFFSAVAACFLFSLGYLHAQEGGSSKAAPPKCFLQVLNGVSSGPVDVYLGDKLIFPAVPPGQRISLFGWPANKFDLRLVDKVSGREWKQKIELAEGEYFTLVLCGDFGPLPRPESAQPTDPQPVRAMVEFLENKLGSNSPVRVRFVNGFVDQTVSIKSPHDGKSWSVPPLGQVVASGLPEDLYLEAYLGDKKKGLYLAQKLPSKNITVVFFPINGALGFKAMTETTPEGLAVDKARMQQQQTEESGIKSP